MKEIKKRVGSILTAEFPEIDVNLMTGVMYLLFRQSPEDTQNLREKVFEVLAIDKEPPYTKEDEEEVLVELLVRTGRKMCQKPELLSIIKEIMADLERSMSEERSHDKSSKRKGDDNDESGAALLNSSHLKRLKK